MKKPDGAKMRIHNVSSIRAGSFAIAKVEQVFSKLQEAIKSPIISIALRAIALRLRAPYLSNSARQKSVMLWLARNLERAYASFVSSNSE